MRMFVHARTCMCVCVCVCVCAGGGGGEGGVRNRVHGLKTTCFLTYSQLKKKSSHHVSLGGLAARR